MKKDVKKEFHPKTSKKRSKKTYSMDNDSHKKVDHYIYNNLSDKLEQNNSNITHINNINIVNMIMSKDKPYKYKNISNLSINCQNRSQSDKKNDIKNGRIKNKRNNTSLLIEGNKKMNYSTISQEDISKFKTHKLFLYSSFDHSKIVQILKCKKKNGLNKTKQKNRSCKQLSNIKLNTNNHKYFNRKNKNKNYNSYNLYDILSDKKSDISELQGKIKKKINSEADIDNIYNNEDLNNQINLKKSLINDNDKMLNAKDLLVDFNYNRETESKEYIDSEMNFRNKQENDDYDKDIEYLKINVPYTIKVNLNTKRKEIKNNSSNYINTNNESIFNLNQSMNKNEFNNIILSKDNIIKFEIKKSNIKYTYNNKKIFIFNNDDEIINFVKKKFIEKNTKYLSELQSKNYISTIFGNSNNGNASTNNVDTTYNINNNVKKKKNNYTGFILTKKVKGKNIFEIELNIYNLESLNKILKNEKFEINGEQMVLAPYNYINILKEENKNTKWEYNKIKEENKNINLNISKLKEDNLMIKMKYGKIKHEYDNLIQDLKIANCKKKEYLEEINKKDMIIKKYEKKINENQNEIKKFEKKISLYESNKNKIFLINNEVQIQLKNTNENIKNKDNINNKENILKSKSTHLNVDNTCAFTLGNLKLFENESKEIQKNWKNHLKIVEIGKFGYNPINNISKRNNKNFIFKKDNNYNICFEGIKKEKKNKIKLIIEKTNHISLFQAQNENIFINNKDIIKKDNNNIIDYISNFNLSGTQKGNNNIIIIEKINNIYYKGTKLETKKENNSLIIQKINEYNFESDKNTYNKNNYLKINSILNLVYEGNKKLKNEFNTLIIENIFKNFNFYGIKKEKKFNNITSEKTFHIFYEKTTKNKNIKIDNIQHLYFEGINKTKDNNNNLILENTINIKFKGIKIEKNNKNNLKFGRVQNIYYEGIQINNKFKNELKIEQIKDLYFEKSIKNLNTIIENCITINFEKSKLNKFKLFEIIKNEYFSFNSINENIKNKIKNILIEKLNNISYEKQIKENKNIPNEIKQVIYFSYISEKKDKINTKKFDILEISKDILSNIFIERQSKNIKIEKLDSSLYEDILETPKKQPSNESTKYASSTSNINSSISTFNKKAEKPENIISSINKKDVKKENKDNNEINKLNNNIRKAERASRAMNRIRKKNQTVIDNNNEISNNIYNVLQNFENKGEVKYRQSLRIMEIAKKLEKEITKQDENDKKEEEIQNDNNDDNNTKYRNSCVIDLISLKPIDSKKKKKNKIGFNG